MATTTRISTPRAERAELAEHVEKWGTFVLANIVWAILSIPVITLPAATAGLFTFMSARARGQQPDFFRTFFEGVMLHWRKATLIAALDVVIGVVIALNLAILPRMEVNTDPIAFLSRSVTVFAVLALLLINLYAWSLMPVLEKLSAWQLITASARLVFTHPLWSLGVLIVAAIPVIFSLLLPQGILVIATASTCALIICKGTWHVIRQHLSPVSSAD